MDNLKNAGMAMVILGILMFCCILPVALNSLAFLVTLAVNPKETFSLYGTLFGSTRFGNITAANLIATAQLSCVALLALIVLIVGVVVMARARRAPMS